MAISTTHAYVQYDGNGVTTAFSVTFQFFLSSEITVTLISTAGVESVKTITTHYTVAGGAGATGTVTMLTAPASGEKLRIERATVATQAFTYSLIDRFSEKSLNEPMDRREMRIQETELKANRALKLPLKDYIAGTGAYDAGNFRIKNLTDGTLATDAVTKQQLEAALLSGADGLSDYPSRESIETTEVPSIRTFFRTAGFSEPGDGGAALYKRAVSEPSHDGKVQSDDGAWWEITGAEGYPEQLGAVGDGSNDDTEAVQSAMDVFKRLIFRPGKTYKVSDTLVLDTGHRLFGHGATLKTTASPANSESLVHWGVFWGDTKQDIVIEGFQFDTSDMTAAPSGATTIRTISMSRCDNILIHNNHFDVAGGATALRGCTNFAVVNNYVFVDSMPTNADGAIDQWGQDGSDIHSFVVSHNVIDGNGEARWGILVNGLEFGGSIFDAHSFSVCNNQIRDCDLDAIWVGGNVIGEGAEARDATITGNVAHGCRKGISLSECRDMTVSGNTLRDVVSVGVHVWENSGAGAGFGGSKINITGNDIAGTGSPSGTPPAIWLEYASDCFVSGNNVDDSSFHFGVALGSETERNVVVGNRIPSSINTKFSNSSSYLTNILSGATYTPTLTGTANVTSVANGNCWYAYDQGRVTVYFAIFIEPTAGTTTTSVKISLPVERTTNFSVASVQGAIFGGGSAGFVNGIVQESSADIVASFTSANTTNAKYTGYFTYLPS